jgi:hypothetical protein
MNDMSVRPFWGDVSPFERSRDYIRGVDPHVKRFENYNDRMLCVSQGPVNTPVTLGLYDTQKGSWIRRGIELPPEFSVWGSIIYMWGNRFFIGNFYYAHLSMYRVYNEHGDLAIEGVCDYEMTKGAPTLSVDGESLVFYNKSNSRLTFLNVNSGERTSHHLDPPPQFSDFYGGPMFHSGDYLIFGRELFQYIDVLFRVQWKKGIWWRCVLDVERKLDLSSCGVFLWSRGNESIIPVYTLQTFKKALLELDTENVTFGSRELYPVMDITLEYLGLIKNDCPWILLKP